MIDTSKTTRWDVTCNRCKHNTQVTFQPGENVTLRIAISKARMAPAGGWHQVCPQCRSDIANGSK